MKKIQVYVPLETADLLLTELHRIKEIVMGIKEDFGAFKTQVDAALAEIQADIEALKTAVDAAGNTPPEVAQQMAEITAKLEAVRNIYNPVTEPPVEPPPDEPL
jgi:prefoldin subunit 5